MEITQINQVWNLLHSITKPFQQVFTSHHISWTKEFCTSLRFPDFRIFFVAIVIKIPSKLDNSNIIFLNQNVLHRPGIRTAFGFAYWHLPGKSAHLQTVTGHFSNTNVLKINLTNIFWIYALVYHIGLRNLSMSVLNIQCMHQ
jgi:hypothetical protein